MAAVQSWNTVVSWADWVLDSYASSVSPTVTDTTFHQHEEDDDSTSTQSQFFTDADSNVQVSSAYGPYVRTGRGGWGNHQWPTDIELARRPASHVDLEANRLPQPTRSLADRRRAAARLESIDTSEAIRMRQSSVQYLSSGRGGSANFVSKEQSIQRSPSYPLSLRSPTADSPKSPKQKNPYAAIGRGGAGNYHAALEAATRQDARREQEQRLAAEETHEHVVEEVDSILQPPPEAWLGGRRKSEAAFEEV
jgi:hypothetical protein